MSKLWFKAKKYGWGWTPCTWEGWTAIAIYVIVMIWNFRRIDSNSHSASDTLIGALPVAIFATVILLIITFKKGEKPGWHWGD